MGIRGKDCREIKEERKKEGIQESETFPNPQCFQSTLRANNLHFAQLEKNVTLISATRFNVVQCSTV